MSETRYTGGCLCGALRYEATGEPAFMGHCYCGDCRKASGSGFIPFMSFPASAIRFIGTSKIFEVPAASGGISTRNFCPNCSSLVFGGVMGESDTFTIYAGSLDDPTLFHPTMAIFNHGRPDWAMLPPGVKTVFEKLPGME
jgi:hypothetical protein